MCNDLPTDDLAQTRRDFAAARREMAELRRGACAFLTMLRYFHRNGATRNAIAYMEGCLRGAFAQRHRQRTLIGGIRRRIADLEKTAWKQVAEVFEKGGTT